MSFKSFLVNSRLYVCYIYMILSYIYTGWAKNTVFRVDNFAVVNGKKMCVCVCVCV